MDAELNGARRKNGFGHAMDDFFVGGANSCENAAEASASGFGISLDKIVRAETNPALHRNQLVVLEIEPLGMHEPGFMITLQNARRVFEISDGFVERCRPVCMR